MQVRLLSLLCQLPDATAAERAALKQVYDQIQDGFEAAVIAEAGKLLAGRSS